MVSRHVFYEGRVQGVGFRHQVCQLARNLPVTGFVKNLYDGRVELYVEGEYRDVDTLLEKVSLAMGEHIEKAVITEEVPQGFEDFGIRF